MMFARIIPLIRTPLGIEGFDYRVPEHLLIETGSLVRIPFRGNLHVGLVERLLTSSPFQGHAIPIHDLYGSIRLPPSFLSLLEATSVRTFSSRPSVLKSWLRHFPKKNPKESILITSVGKGGIEGFWSTDHTSSMLASALRLQKTKRVLIVTPWIHRVVFFQKTLPQAHILHSDLADGAAHDQWIKFLSKKNGCLIATKIGAWLGTCADIVLLDEPERDDHKQDELAPRYDARKVLLWCAQHHYTRVESYGLTPPLHASAPAPAIDVRVRLFLHHPHARSSLPLIPSDALEVFLHHSGPRVILHPIAGTLARISCRDCHWQFLCERCQSPLSSDDQGVLCRRCHARFSSPPHCPSCHGLDLSKSLPGIQRLAALWNTQFPGQTIEWRDGSYEQQERPFLPQTALLVTDVRLLGAGEDIRRKERQCIAFRALAHRLALVNGTMLLPCSEAFAPFLHAWLTTEGMRDFFQKEREERRAFGYPPTTRVVKIIVKGDASFAETWQTEARRLLHATFPRAQWRGPLPVEYLPLKRGPRHIVHLILPSEVEENVLLSSLRPLVSSRIIIDIDPVAFLR